MWRRKMSAAVGLLLALVSISAQAQFSPRGYGQPVYSEGPSLISYQIMAYIVLALLGFLVGFLFSPLLRKLRPYISIIVLSILILLSFYIMAPVNAMIAFVLCFIIPTQAFKLGSTLRRKKAGGDRSVTFGSAQWATLEMLQRRNRIGDQGFALGYFPSGDTQVPIHYASDRHLLTVAPTRAGKGVSSIIPNLLTYRGSALVIDPKGENAAITAARRGQGDPRYSIQGLGQNVHIVDPWGLTTQATGLEPACFNPLDWLDLASPEIGENAMMLADALVVPAPGSKDQFWDEEAKALLMGFILHVATSPDEASNRHLGRVRDLLMLPAQAFVDLCVRMAISDQPVVASTGARTAGKEPKLLSSVIASAQAHTHFLDSPSLRESLSRSDFRFEDLKRTPTTVYLVLPADRLDTFGRWLRLLVQQAITVTARNVADRPERPILFLLDEMAALGRLSMVEQAYGLMAGFGMQLWGIVQDLSQLHRIYGDGWQTFIGNSGVLQYFGSRDKMTAEYFSALCGEATVTTLTSSISKAFSGQGTTSTTSHNHGETQRKLIMPDELMRLNSAAQLVLIENENPIAGRKIQWFTDNRFMGQGVNVRKSPGSPPRVVPVTPPPERMAAE